MSRERFEELVSDALDLMHGVREAQRRGKGQGARDKGRGTRDKGQDVLKAERCALQDPERERGLVVGVGPHDD